MFKIGIFGRLKILNYSNSGNFLTGKLNELNSNESLVLRNTEDF